MPKKPVPHSILFPFSNSLYHTTFVSLPHIHTSLPHIQNPTKMVEAAKILRSSVHTFLTGYTSFISIASSLVLPFSASFLISQSYIISSPRPLRFISSRLGSLFQAASLPESSKFISLVNAMLSQTIFSTAFTLPCALTFLLLAKTFIVHTAAKKAPPNFTPVLNLYPAVLLTHLFNSFLIISANATVFIFLFLALNAAVLLGFDSDGFSIAASSISAVVYSMAVANTVVTCNMALVVSAAEKCSGYVSVLKARVLIRGRIGTALSIALPTGLLMAAVEALFQYRVMVRYHLLGKLSASIVCEAFMIACMHSVVLVVEVIAGFLFYDGCRLNCAESWELEPEEKGEV